MATSFPFFPVGAPAVLLGTGLLTLRSALNLDGFFDGLLIGAGITLILAGSVLVGVSLSRVERLTSRLPMWLPSRDSDR